MNAPGREKRARRFAPDRFRHVTGDGAPSSGVRAASVKDLNAEARQIVERARAQAAEVEARAYRAGFAEGEKAGQAATLEQLAPYLDHFRKLTRELARLREIHLKAIEPEVLSLAVEIARKIVHDEIEANPEVIGHVARAAIRDTVDRARVTIRVAPRDHAFLARFRPDLLRIEGVKEVVIEEDERIEPGGCLVETESGQVDARIDSQFAQFEHLRDAYDA